MTPHMLRVLRTFDDIKEQQLHDFIPCVWLVSLVKEEESKNIQCHDKFYVRQLKGMQLSRNIISFCA